MKEYLAQLFAQIPDMRPLEVALAYGPLGAFCLWLMFRTEKKLDSVAPEIVAELRVLGHRINGMSRALLFDVASRETTGAAIRTLAEAELTKLEREDEVTDIRARAAKAKAG